MIHVAVMLEDGISGILSMETPSDQVGEVQRIDPGYCLKQVNVAGAGRL
jgi:hypothetical protein